MIYVKINGTLYPAAINGCHIDREWGNRESKSIHLEMTYADAAALFVNGLAWSIVMDVAQPVLNEDGTPVLDEQGNPTFETVQEEYDNADYSLAGSITDNRDGTLSVKMGKPTEVETLQSQLANAVTEEELNAAYTEGVNSL